MAKSQRRNYGERADVQHRIESDGTTTRRQDTEAIRQAAKEARTITERKAVPATRKP
jgi:hypothetical protein